MTPCIEAGSDPNLARPALWLSMRGVPNFSAYVPFVERNMKFLKFERATAPIEIQTILPARDRR
jgi:hypothetical protein